MPQLDQASTTHQPAPWTGEMVRNRLVEAFEIDRRLPRERSRTAGSSWPAKPIHEFVDVVYWNEGEQRERVWESWERSANVSPQEITRMEAAFGWLQWVPMEERRNLEAWALATATRRSVSAILRKRGLPRTSFYRLRDKAADSIAAKLNAKETWQTNPSP
jgi:hypothetical protein